MMFNHYDLWWCMRIMWVVSRLRMWVMRIISLGMRVVWIVMRRLSMGIVRVIVVIWRWSTFDDNMAWITTIRVVMNFDYVSRIMWIMRIIVRVSMRIMVWFDNLDNVLWWAMMTCTFGGMCLERCIVSHKVRLIKLIHSQSKAAVAEEVPRIVHRFKRDGFRSVVEAGNNLPGGIIVVLFMVLSGVQKCLIIAMSQKVTREIH
jgi:hypothetical protein